MNKYYYIIPLAIANATLASFYFLASYVDPWNLTILYVEIGFGFLITNVVYNRTKKSEKNVEDTLKKITTMVKEDYDLKLQRKYQVAQNLQMSLAANKQASDFIADQMNSWLKETDKPKKDEIKKQAFHAYSQIEYGYNRLKDIRSTSIDVLDARISNDIELLIHCFKDKPEFNETKNECYTDDWETGSYLIEKIQAQIASILRDDPDSFESNFTCTIEDKKLEDGTSAKVSVVTAKTKKDEEIESMKWIDKSLNSDPTDLTKLCQKAFQLISEEKHSAAISYCNKVLEVEPKNILAKINKGNALDNLGNFKEAIKLYDEVLEIEPENTLALNNKGMAYMIWGKLKKAIPCFEKSVQIEPNNIRGLQDLGYCYYYNKKYEKAKEIFERLLELNPNDSHALEMKNHAEEKLAIH